jgi:hypothetical protein
VDLAAKHRLQSRSRPEYGGSIEARQKQQIRPASRILAVDARSPPISEY